MKLKREKNTNTCVNGDHREAALKSAEAAVNKPPFVLRSFGKG